MEKRFKKQRNKLFLVVALILTGVFLVVTATYCAIRIYNEKSNVQDREYAAFSDMQRKLSGEPGNPENMLHIFLNDTNLLYFKNQSGMDNNSQLVVINRDNDRVITDSAGKLLVNYSISMGSGSSWENHGVIDRGEILDCISKKQAERIRALLSEPGKNGVPNMVICSKFHWEHDKIVPVELAVLPVENENDPYLPEDVLETFAMKDKSPGEKIYECSDIRLNIIPESFLFGDDYNKDIIGALSEEQKKESITTISDSLTHYVFYSSEYLYLNAYISREKSDTAPVLDDYSVNETFYLIQYAKRINLLENCMYDLIFGTVIIFLFFFIIGIILCLTIWKVLRVEMLQERKRADMTNALAHDIKTPLFVINGFAYSLKEDIDSENRDSYLDRIIMQTDEINNLVHNMLELTKLDSGAMSLNKTEFDINEMISSILENYKTLRDGKTISFECGDSCIISGDKDLIKTALRNLIDNAVKYSLKDSVINIVTDEKTLTISNKSEPLTKSDLKKIWQPYVRKDKSRHKSGNGLGLSIVRSILVLHKVKFDITMKEKDTVVFRAVF